MTNSSEDFGICDADHDAQLPEDHDEQADSCDSCSDSLAGESRFHSCHDSSSKEDGDDQSSQHEVTVIRNENKAAKLYEVTNENQRNLRKPERPPRVKDNMPAHSSTEYYNLCHPPPEEEEEETLPTLPRRKPYISSPDSPKSGKPRSGQHENPPTMMNLINRGNQRHFDSVRSHGGEPNPIYPGELPDSTSTGTLRSIADHHTHTSSFRSRLGSERRRCGSRSSGVSSLTTRTMQYRKKNMSRQRRRGSACHCRDPVDKKEDEVVLLYSKQCQGSTEWARYLYKLFTELSKHKGKLTVRHLPVEDVAASMPAHLESEIFNARLQLVILSPLFLRWVQYHPNQLVGRLLQQDRVIALLVGVREEQVTTEHRSSLVSFPQWVHLEARDHDLEFVQTVLYFSAQILQRTELRESSLAETFFFSIFPRKVTESQNRVMLVLDRPVNTRSSIRITVDRSGGRVPVEDVKLKNPYTIVANLPICLMAKSCLVNLYLEIDGESKGFRQLKCEAKQHELEILLCSVLDPIEFLCETVGVSSQCKDQLDEHLTQSFLSNIPRYGLPLLSIDKDDPHTSSGKAIHEYPTLLHFSAAHGLEQLTCALLDCPGAQAALTMRNTSDMTPEDLAKEFGYFDLSEIIKSHQVQPSKFSHIYDYIKHGHCYPPRDGSVSAAYAPAGHLTSTLRHGATLGRDAPLVFAGDIKPVKPGPTAAAGSVTASDFSQSDYSGLDPAEPVAVAQSAYKVPPPPRPVPESPVKKAEEAQYQLGRHAEPGSPGSMKHANYLDMTGSHSNTPSPGQKRRPESAETRKSTNLRDITLLLHSLEMHMERNSRRILAERDGEQRHLWSHIETKEDRLDRVALGNTYQYLPDGPVDDRFGTMRASHSRRSLREKNPGHVEYANFKADPFGTLRAERRVGNPDRKDSLPSSINDDVFVPGQADPDPGHRDREGHRDRAPVKPEEKDYRGMPEESQLAATEELLSLLEEFKQKSYTVKEMEMLFENWRRKVDITQLTPKSTKPNKASTLMRMFKPKDVNPHVKSTQNTKKFTKENNLDESELNESDMSVVCLPDTPLKSDEGRTTGGLSSQILPLHRFSSESSLPKSGANPPAYKDPPKPKPVAEVSPFSSKKKGEKSEINKSQGLMTSTVSTLTTSSLSSMTLTNNKHSKCSIQNPQNIKENPQVSQQSSSSSRSVTQRSSTPNLGKKSETKTTSSVIHHHHGHQPVIPQLSPIREKLMRFRRSVTEPLFQYFHEMHMQSPDIEEPDVLNTPKTLLPTIADESTRRLSRRLFGGGNDSITGQTTLGDRTKADEKRDDSPQRPEEEWTRHPAKTSQVNEYVNISPTPSTDL